MTAIILTSLLILTGLVISRPLMDKPLSEDDGNWFYLGVFWHRGLRPFAGFGSMHGYFGAQLIFALFYRLLSLKSLRAIPVFKVLWNILTALSVYWLGLCLWHSQLAGTIAAVFYLTATIAPNTMFALTYAEHFYGLPINLSIIAAYYGLSLNQPIFFAIAGLMAGWAFQFKPTTLLFCVLLPLVTLRSDHVILNPLIYSGAFVLVYLIPLGLLHGNAQGREIYQATTLGPFNDLLRIYASRLRSAPAEATSNGYTAIHYSLGLREQWRRLKANTLPALKDLYPLALLALIQLGSLLSSFDPGTVAMSILVLVHIMTVVIQRNFYTPHFNPIWSPVSLLAAKFLSDLLQPFNLMSPSFVLGATIAILLGLYFVLIIMKSFAPEQRNQIGYMHPATGAVFRLAETIGNFIRTNSQPDEKLLVWGDHPSLYLYAGREVFDTRFMFFYANLGKLANEALLIDALRTRPPELIQFFNYKLKDDWDINRIQQAIRVPYRPIKRFCIQDEQGRTQLYPNGTELDFSLYRRDERLYREILLDRALLSLREGQTQMATIELAKLFTRYPDFYEARLRHALIATDAADRLDWLNEQLEQQNGRLSRGVLMRLTSEELLSLGQREPAIEALLALNAANPEDFRCLILLGEVTFAQGQLDDARICFQNAIKINAWAIEAWNDLGVTLNQLGNLDAATECFGRALRINPAHPEARANINALTPS